jgi:ribosomal protein S18 acetylase RimI-like enzyme
MELCRFYVTRKYQGTGVASQMLGIVLAHAELQGSESLWLSVWQENARAIAFYQKWGFATIGETKFLMGEDLQDDFIMERAVQTVRPQSE